MYLFATPEKEAGCYCCDHFSYNDQPPEDWWGLAIEEDATPAAETMLIFLANKLPKKIDAEVTYTDGGDQALLLINKKDWRRKDVQTAWAEVIATPLEKLVEQADLAGDARVTEQVFDYWANQHIGDRVREMIYMRNQGHISTDDLSAAILDDAPEWIVQGVIAHQVECMLRG